MTKPNVIEMHDITKKFGEFVANDHINLDVRQGEIHALLGENGAGKTSTIKSILKLIRHNTGSMKFEGKEYNNIFDIYILPNRQITEYHCNR